MCLCSGNCPLEHYCPPWFKLETQAKERVAWTIISRFDREKDEDEGFEYKDILRSNHVCHARPPRLLALENIAMRRRRALEDSDVAFCLAGTSPFSVHA